MLGVHCAEVEKWGPFIASSLWLLTASRFSSTEISLNIYLEYDSSLLCSKSC
ncbi:rCG55728 [Rattus norvegicus]|uniref:RCG55728 n=1 Tax=Rattus norvegicus TaxID=10116 RepID=A6JLT8_RAT|nr:rCG55728 [Rattus norvegicus]